MGRNQRIITIWHVIQMPKISEAIKFLDQVEVWRYKLRLILACTVQICSNTPRILYTYTLVTYAYLIYHFMNQYGSTGFFFIVV